MNTEITCITEGLYTYKSLHPKRTLYSTNVYIFKGKERSLVVDPGWLSNEALEQFVGVLKELEIDQKDTFITYTHAHKDHFGPARLIQQETECRFLLPKIDGAVYHELIEREMASIDACMKTWGLPEGHVKECFKTSRDAWSALIEPPYEAFENEDCLHFGDFELKAIWTPGHTYDHICFYDQRRKLLLSGDMIMKKVTPCLCAPMPGMRDSLNLFQYSLRKLRTINVALVLPGHGKPITDMTAEINREYMANTLRSEEVLKLCANEHSCYELFGLLHWNVPFERMTNGEVSVAMLETQSHLEYLCNTGMLDIRFCGETAKYKAKCGDIQSQTDVLNHM